MEDFGNQGLKATWQANTQALMANTQALQNNTASKGGSGAGGGINGSNGTGLTGSDLLNSVQKDKNGKYRYKAGTVIDGKKVGGQYVKGGNAAVEAAQASEAKNAAAKSNAAGAALGASLALQGAAGAVTGYSTASTTAKDKEGNEYEMSEQAKNVSRGSTSFATGIASIFSPVLGSLVGMGMDALNTYVIAPAIDAVKIAREKRVNAANTKLSAYSSIKADVSTFSELANKDVWTTEDFNKNDEAMSSIIEKMYQKDSKGKDVNKNARETLKDYLVNILKNQGKQIDATDSLGTIMDKYGSGSLEDRKMLAHALELAEAQANTEALKASYENEFNTQRKEAREVYGVANKEAKKTAQALGKAAAGAAAASITGAGIAAGVGAGAAIGAAVSSWTGPGAIVGAIVGGAIGGLAAGLGGGIGIGNAVYDNVYQESMKTFSYQWDTAGFGGQIDILQEQLKRAEADGDSKRVSELNEAISTLKEIRDQTKAINKKVDQSLTQEALLGATNAEGQFLSLMTSIQLKNMGPDEIKRLVADYLITQGGYSGGAIYANTETKELSEYADQLITAALKNSDVFSSIITGGVYTLSEALQLPTTTKEGYVNKTNVQILENFAAALHVSVEELQNFEDKFGSLTLGDFMLTSTEAIEKIQNIGSMMSEIAGASKSWAETTSTIIKQYPQLIQYLNDSVALQTALWDQAEQLSYVQIQGLYEDLVGNATYFKTSIEPALKALQGYGSLNKNEDFSKVTDIAGLMQWINNYQNTDEYGAIAGQMDAIIHEALGSVDLVSDLMREQLNTVLQYQSTLLQKEIDNLNEQKSALEDINKEREYENRLIEAKIKLEEAQKQKKRVWREGVGWVYEADQNAVKEAQENLANVQREMPIAELSLHIEELMAQKQELEEISSKRQLEEQKALYESFVDKYFDSSDGIPNSILGFQKVMESMLGKDGAISKIASDIYDEIKNDEQTKKEKALQNLRSTYDTLMGTMYDANGQKINMATASDAQKTAYNNALMAYQAAYASAANSGYLSSNDFDETLSDTVFGSQQSKDLAGADTYDIINQGRVYAVGFNGKKYKATTNIVEKLDDLNNGFSYWAPGTEISDSTRQVISESYLKNYADGSGLKWLNQSGADGAFIDLRTKNANGHSYAVFMKNGPFGAGLYKVVETAARGSLGLLGGTTMVNERGTEAIITPSGTLTALPSNTGVVPAEITRNVWQLGELAPSILRALGYPNMMTTVADSHNSSEALNIGSIVMNVSADEQWDPEKFVRELKNLASLNKNNKR